MAKPPLHTRQPIEVPRARGSDRVRNQVREVVTSMSPASVGIELALAVLLGLGIGSWIDGRLGSFPAFTLVFLGLGMAAGFKGVWREARKAMPDPDPEGK